MKTRPLFSAMDISLSGLIAQRQRMNAIAENLANAETTRTAEGGPYRRKRVALKTDQSFPRVLSELDRAHDRLRREHQNHLPGRTAESGAVAHFSGVKAVIETDTTPFREVYDPTHPDADENGIVKMPNVDLVQEMTQLISAARAFEANVTAFNAAKGMMKKALEL